MVNATSSPAFSTSLFANCTLLFTLIPGRQPKRTPIHALAAPNAPSVYNIGAAVREHIAARSLNLAAVRVGLPDVARGLPSYQ